MISATFFLTAAIIIYPLYLIRAKSKDLQHEKKVRERPNPHGTISDPRQLIPLPRVPFWSLVKRSFLYRFDMSRLIRYFGTFKPVVLFSLFGAKFTIINDLSLAKELLQNPIFLGKSRGAIWMSHSQGDYGIVNTRGKKWEEQRKFCLRQLKKYGFGTKSMESFIINQIDNFMTVLREAKGGLVSPNKKFYLPILNSLWMTLVGAPFTNDKDPIYNMLLRVYGALMSVTSLPEQFITSGPWSQKTIDRILKWLPVNFFSGVTIYQKSLHDLHAYMKAFINERQKTFDSEDISRNLMDDYLKQIYRTTDEDSDFYGETGMRNLLGMMADFFIAGGDTTANMLSWCMLHLVRNPDIQAKIRSEIDKVVGPNRSPLLDDRINCPYTEAFIHEALRYNPIGMISLPHESIEDSNIGPYFIPKGTTIFLNVLSIHHSTSIWGDPENFRPERFLSPDGKTFVKNDNMIAFSVGRRKCPGEQLSKNNLFLFVSTICQNFILNKDPRLKHNQPLEWENSGFHIPKAYYMIAQDRWNETEKMKKEVVVPKAKVETKPKMDLDDKIKCSRMISVKRLSIDTFMTTL